MPPETKKAGPQEAPRKHGWFSTRRALKNEQEVFERGLVNVLDYIAPAAFAVTPQYVQLENLYAKTLFVYSYARYLNTNWLSRIVNLDIQADISMFIYPLNTDEVMNELRRKIGQLQSTETIQAEKGQVRDPQLQTAIGDIEVLRDALARGEDRLFQFGIYFTIYATKLEDLTTLSKQLEALLGGLLIYTKQALMQMEQGFNASLPLGNDELLINRNLDTASLSTTFPFVSSELTSNDGILYGINLHNSSLVLFDRFSLENANSVVFAASGAGKSFAVKLEALRSMMWGTDVIVIDPENEYERIAKAVGGSFLSLSLNSKERINPFDLPKTAQYEEGEDILRSAVVSIKNLVAIMVGGLSPDEDALLDRAVYEAYALKDITTDPRTHQNEPPIMKDLQSILANMTGAESLVRKLSKFTEGTFAGLFNQRTNINLENGFVVFSIRDLEEQLRPIGMFLVLNFIWNQARYQMRKRMVVVDEAWILMRYKDSSDFLYSLAKRARKYFLGLTIITQDVEDFITSQQGRTIVNNSAMRLLLRQAPSAVDKLTEVFKLTEGEKLILREAKVGQGIFFAGSNHVAIEIIASYEEEQLITTNPAELMKIREAEAERAKAKAPGQTVNTTLSSASIAPPMEASTAPPKHSTPSNSPPPPPNSPKQT
ncbi:ATP-binding protein [Candidatus Berkelbacteria bacterium]|nr:ATP-binding protein [Candidatus Berkelbacteria bacterium]